MSAVPRWRQILLLVVACPLGCILVVTPAPEGDRCRFRGEETECGRCLSVLCGAEVDAACFDELVLSAAEQCASAGDEACGRVPSSALSRCMHSSCAARCYARTGRSMTTCSENFLGVGLACSCKLGGDVNDLACSSAFYTRARCCAPTAWPGPALECACKATACSPTSDGCICVLTASLEATDAETCRGTHCCAVDDRCHCRTRACSAAEREVPSCSKRELSCPRGSVELESCSIRE